MRISSTHTISLAALLAFAGTATMQAAEQAKFHLTAPAHWGQAVLQPGDYRVLLPSLSLGQMGLRIEGAGQTFYTFPLTTDKSENYSDYSYLKLSDVNGTYFVRELSSGVSGRTFIFPVPKEVRHQQMAKRRDSTLALAVK